MILAQNRTKKAKSHDVAPLKGKYEVLRTGISISLLPTLPAPPPPPRGGGGGGETRPGTEERCSYNLQ